MKIIFSAIVLTLSLLFLGHVFSQSTQLKENEQEFPFSKLTLEIATPKEAFAQIEPIPIVLTISNKTSRPIRGHTALDFSGNHVEVLVRRDYGEVYKVKQLSLLIEDIVATPRKLKPGEHYQSTQILTLDLENIFPYPSSYQIQVLFYNDDRKEKVKSNVLNIRIEQPEGINLQAIEYIKSKGNPAIFFTGSGLVGNEEAQRVLEEFVTNFGESVYGDHATFLLGKLYFFKGEHEKAIKQFDKIAKKKDFVFSDKNAEYLKEAKEKGNTPLKPD